MVFLAQLLLKLNDGNGLAAVFLTLEGMLFNQGMRRQKFADAPAKRPSAVPVNNSHARFLGQRGVVQKFVQLIRRFFDSHADDIDFVGFGSLPGLGGHGHVWLPAG